MSARRACLVVASLALLAATHRAGTYTNDEFAFKVLIPPKASTCGAEPPEQDDAINVYLDGAGDGCDRLAERPYVGVSAAHNAAEYGSARQAIEGVCTANGAKEVTPPRNLGFRGRRSAVCRGDSSDTAWIDVWVVTQAGRSGQAEVNYSANLHTMVSRLDKDLPAFRALLGTGVTLGLPEAIEVGNGDLCDRTLSVPEIRDCMSKEVEQSDAALAQRIRDLDARLSAEEKSHFANSQQAWLRYRDLQCEADGFLSEGAALQPVQVSDCRVWLTRERIREVQRILEHGR